MEFTHSSEVPGTPVGVFCDMEDVSPLSTPGTSHKTPATKATFASGEDNSTPQTMRTMETNASAKSHATGSSMFSLADIERELNSVIEKVNMGEKYDEKRLDQLIHMQSEHPEYQHRLQQELDEWTLGVEDFLAECLVAIRTFVPVNIACTNKDQIQMDCPELRPETLRRLMEKKCLWLVRMSVDDIDRLADGELLDRYNPTADNLDIVELSAVYASLPSVFSNDTTGKKTELKTAIMHMLQRLMRERDEGTLASIKTRSPAYCDEEYGPVEDITSTYSVTRVAGISSDEWEGRAKPRRSFQDVCSRHSILSLRRGVDGIDPASFTNVFAQYSGPDLVHCGWLKKETGNLVITSIFQSRYAVLTKNDRLLRYFQREDDTEPKGTCDLKTIVEIKPQSRNMRRQDSIRDSIGAMASPEKEELASGKDDGRGKRFTLTNDKGKTWVFQAKDAVEREEWVGHLEYVWMSV